MATPPVNSQIKLSLPATISPSVDPAFRGYLEELVNAIQQLQSYVEQYCGITQKIAVSWPGIRPEDTLLDHQLNRFYGKAAEPIISGGIINIHDAGAGVLGLRNADASNNTRPAHGWCTTQGGIATGEYGEVILGRGLITNITGLVIGTRYFLSTTAGVITNAQPVAAGNITQYIGTAIGTQLLLADINQQWVQH